MKHAAAGGLAPPFSKALAVALLSAGLGACGGGGGGDGAPPSAMGFPSAPAPAPRPAPAPPPAPSSAPAPAGPRVDPYAPVAGSEPLPLLTAPQPGSTADVGNGSEGLYDEMFGYTFVSSRGELARTMLLGTLWGSVSVTGPNWSFNPDTQFYYVKASPVTGSGTFSAKASMDGNYSTDGRSPEAWGPLRYSSANALAVTQDSVTGTWSNIGEKKNIGLSITVNETGYFSGRTAGSEIGVCAVTGAVGLSQPNSAKNFYALSLNATNAAAAGEKACQLDTAAYGGPAAIIFASAGSFAGNGYFRNLGFVVRTANKATLSASLRRQ